MHDQCEIVKSGIRRRIRRIAFFAPAGWEYVDRLVEGVLRYQADRGGVVVREFRYDPKEPENQETWSKRRRPWDSWADGLVVNISNDPGLYEWVAAGGEPVVNTGGQVEMTCVFISPDSKAERAIEHFKVAGFTNFAFVSQVPENTVWPAFARRLKEMGVVSAHVSVGVNPSRWDFDFEDRVSSDTGLLGMLHRVAKPVAILCENDEVGKVVCMAAQRAGYRVPHEVAVLGINNFASSRASIPPLSSIHTPGDEVGYRATEVVVKMIDGQEVPRRVELPAGKVVVRQSTTSGRNNEIDMLHVIAVIRDRACEGVGLDKILLDLQVSQSTLRREFARIVGCTPGEEMARIRLERAKELLQSGDLGIAHVAAATGYASQTNFTTFFKGRTGMTPREYRRRQGKPKELIRDGRPAVPYDIVANL